MTPLIVCEHVEFRYENHDVINDLSLEIYPGDYICVVGENGSGKSTLMKGFLGLIKPTAGNLFISEELKKSGIGYLSQQNEAKKDFPATVEEVVLSGCLNRMGLRPFYSNKERRQAELNMEKLGILEIRKQCYQELSGGQHQRTLIARALCATDRFLILDEPVTGLDPAAILEFYQILEQLNRQDHVTILMVSHDIQNVVHFANKILHLNQNVLFYGDAAEYQKSSIGRRFM